MYLDCMMRLNRFLSLFICLFHLFFGDKENFYPAKLLSKGLAF